MYVQKVDDEIEVADAAVDENLPRILIGRCKVLEAPRQVSTSRSAMDSPNQASQFNTIGTAIEAHGTDKQIVTQNCVSITENHSDCCFASARNRRT